MESENETPIFPSVDVNLLPKTALIDTGVFFRFLERKLTDPQYLVCAAVCQAMIKAKNTIFIAAPTLAEAIRKEGKPIPRVQGIVVVPFDERAADILGQKMPMAKINEVATATGFSKTYLKYDALIAACAIRARTDTIIALDTDHTTMLGVNKVRVAKPDEFLTRQVSMPFTQ